MRVNRWVALVIVLFGVGYLLAALQIRESTTYSAVGPRFFPNVLGSGIVLSGVWLFLAPGAPGGEDAPQHQPLVWRNIGLMGGIVILYIFLFKPLGYILSTGLVMIAGSLLLSEERRPLRDLLVSIGLAVTVYFVFTRLLNINLPEGLIPM